MSDSLMAGFKPLKAGRIHFRCPQCGRKMSNMKRDAYDPPRAVMTEIACPKHSDQGEQFWYDAKGEELDADEIMAHIDSVSVSAPLAQPGAGSTGAPAEGWARCPHCEKIVHSRIHSKPEDFHT